MWEFDEAVEVRSDVVDGVETPEQFLWRGRLWRVCSVQAHWTETAAWWERGIIGAGLGATYGPTRPGADPRRCPHERRGSAGEPSISRPRCRARSRREHHRTRSRRERHH